MLMRVMGEFGPVDLLRVTFDSIQLLSSVLVGSISCVGLGERNEVGSGSDWAQLAQRQPHQPLFRYERVIDHSTLVLGQLEDFSNCYQQKCRRIRFPGWP